MQMWMKRRYELQMAQGTQQSRRQRGFTLIEIMVVIAILGILAALIVPKIMSRPDEARRVAAKADIGSVMQSLNLYRLDNGRYPTQEQGLRDIDGVDHAFVTNLAGAQGDRVGAVVVCDTAPTTIEHLRRSARELLSSFKVPTVWLLLDADDTIPRGPTGKVDVRRLREMLNTVDSQASH